MALRAYIKKANYFLFIVVIRFVLQSDHFYYSGYYDRHYIIIISYYH